MLTTRHSSLPPARAGATALLLALATSLPAQRTTIVPFVYDDARVYVPVSVNGAEPRWLILDTGAQPTVLDVGFARRLQLPLTDIGAQGGAGRGSSQHWTTSGLHLSVGDVALNTAITTVAPLDSRLTPFSGRGVPGIIGSQFFIEHVIEVDFVRRQLTVHDTSYRYAGAGAAVPIHLAGGVPLIDGSITLPTGRTVPARLLVDLGAKFTLLVSEPFMKRHGVAAESLVGVTNTLGAGLGGETIYRFARLPGVVAGDGAVHLQNVVAGFSTGGTLRSERYDALLGAESLKRYHLVLDYPHQRIVFDPVSPAPPQTELDMSGMYLTAEGAGLRRFIVHRVVAESPAAAAGIAAGDVIAELDATPASNLTLDALRATLKAEGREVVLGIDRAGRRVTVKLRLRRLV